MRVSKSCRSQYIQAVNVTCLTRDNFERHLLVQRFVVYKTRGHKHVLD